MLNTKTYRSLSGLLACGSKTGLQLVRFIVAAALMELGQPSPTIFSW